MVIDDMIDTAGTICEAVRTLHDHGAKSVTLVATHGLLSGPAVERLKDSGGKEIVLTDTVPIPAARSGLPATSRDSGMAQTMARIRPSSRTR